MSRRSRAEQGVHYDAAGNLKLGIAACDTDIDGPVARGGCVSRELGGVADLQELRLDTRFDGHAGNNVAVAGVVSRPAGHRDGSTVRPAALQRIERCAARAPHQADTGDAEGVDGRPVELPNFGRGVDFARGGAWRDYTRAT